MSPPRGGLDGHVYVYMYKLAGFKNFFPKIYNLVKMFSFYPTYFCALFKNPLRLTFFPFFSPSAHLLSTFSSRTYILSSTLRNIKNKFQEGRREKERERERGAEDNDGSMFLFVDSLYTLEKVVAATFFLSIV